MAAPAQQPAAAAADDLLAPNPDSWPLSQVERLDHVSTLAFLHQIVFCSFPGPLEAFVQEERKAQRAIPLDVFKARAAAPEVQRAVDKALASLAEAAAVNGRTLAQLHAEGEARVREFARHRTALDADGTSNLVRGILRIPAPVSRAPAAPFAPGKPIAFCGQVLENAGYDFDYVVIGGGSGGVASARRAASYGARVALIERHRLGGTCVNYGCVPKKLYVYAALFRSELSDARGFGWDVPDVSFDWRRMKARKNAEIGRLNGIYEGMLAKSGVHLVRGTAVLENRHTVVVDCSRKITGAAILLATGARAVIPEDLPGAELAVTSQQVLEFDDEHFATLPRSVAIAGSGYIGCEFASVMRELGVAVTLLVRGRHVLSGFDHDVRRHVTENLRALGVDVQTETRLAALRREADGAVRVEATDGRSWRVDKVVLAVGRTPHSSGLGLERVGVRVDVKGAIAVNEYSQTSVPNIFAVGDVTNRVQLTPVAIAEGRALAETLFNSNPMAIDHSTVASAVFAIPEAASVGLSEERAAALFDGQIRVFTTSFNPMRNTLSGRQQKIMMKVVVAAASDRVLGYHMVGPGASEQVQCLAATLSAGITKRQLDRTIAVHPTAAEEWVLLRDAVPLSFHKL